jgi:hypothetical protein
MALRRLRFNRKGGILLDAVLSLALLVVGAFLLESIGISFGEIVHGAMRFFGLA